MLDFSSSQGKFGNFLRTLLYRIPYQGYIPILQGEARGMLWKRSSGDEGYWLGTYEIWKQKALSPLLLKGSVLYDIGAYAGFFSLLGCKKGATVYAFEPEAHNLELLREHLKKNKCNATVMDFAVSDRDGTEKFEMHESRTSHHLSEKGNIEVRCRSIDSLVKEIPPPTVIKIDAEGAERKILIGAKETITKYKPIILVEGTKESFEDLLLNYTFTEIHQNEYVCTPSF